MEQISQVGDAPAVVVQRDAPGVTGGAEAQLSASDAELYARFFSVLSDPTRVRLLHLLLDAPEAGRTLSELVAAIGAPQGRISTHLGCLRWCGLVQPYRDVLIGHALEIEYDPGPVGCAAGVEIIQLQHARSPFRGELGANSCLFSKA